MKDYYKILDVPRLSSQDAIKAAYHAKARKYHPDINKSPDAEEIFREINEAYSVLKNPVKKNIYDADLRAEEEDVRRSNDNNYSFTGTNRRYEGVSLATLVRCLNKERIDQSTIIFHRGKPYRISAFDGSKVTFVPVEMSKKQENTAKNGGYVQDETEPEGNLRDALHFYWYDMIHSTRGIVLIILFGCIIIIAAIQFFMNFTISSRSSYTNETVIADPMADMPKETVQPNSPVAGMPPNGAIQWYQNIAGNIPVEVSVPKGNDYYYVLIKNADTGERVLSVYIYKGKTAKITMPAGNFAVYYTNFPASEWTGPDTVGQNSLCAKCRIFLALSQGTRSKTRLSLKPVSEANSEITVVTYDEFIR
ncbi:MAG: DnaJ domain-containing protein [Abditibacteriota bacterium]|nr:DnaJ domain-containing protein [Abditibacteriota bacterium]